jgi:peptidoglycan/LPS O-acetylase OafA/YrhL
MTPVDPGLGPHRSKTGRRWAGLDGLRGLAVLSVVLFHLGLLPNGYLGVDVFFVLSGFLITSLVLGEHARTGTVSLRRFYLRRSLRLFPALAAMVAFCVAVAVVTRTAVADALHDAAVSLFYVANLTTMPSGLIDHTWTLALEEQFYLLWPALLLLALRRPGSRWAFAPALAVTIAILAADLALGQAGAVHTYTRAMGLPLGCALALGVSWTRGMALLGRCSGLSALALLVLVALPVPAALTTGWPVSLGAVLSVPIVVLLTTRRVPVLESAVLRWFGLRSYSLYLWHFPLLTLTVHHVPGSIPATARHLIGLLASLGAAELSYRWVEQPVLRFRDRRTNPESGPIAGQPSDARHDVIELSQPVASRSIQDAVIAHRAPSP